MIKNYYFCGLKNYAQLAELVDALVSGTSVRKDVQVRVLFWVQQNDFRIQRFQDSKISGFQNQELWNYFCPGGGIGRHATLRG